MIQELLYIYIRNQKFERDRDEPKKKKKREGWEKKGKRQIMGDRGIMFLRYDDFLLTMILNLLRFLRFF